MRNMQPRIWNKITGEIAMIDVIDWNDKYVIVSQDFIWNEDPETGEGECQVYFKDLELMWPTGLLDKNGVEIFEGDIFGKIYALRCVVEQKSDGQWVCVFLDPRIGTKPITDKVVLESSKEGNIHENPELLKEDKV